MKTYRKLTFICFIVLTGMSYAQTVKQVPIDPKIRTGKLSNGLTYYIRHHNIPEGCANFYIAQKVGSILEEENQRGLAHFLEHMCFNGTKNFPGNTLIEELEKKGIRFGADINAYTSLDETVYTLKNIPTTREGIIDTALLVLHDWSGFVSLNDQDIEDERGVIREEWRTINSSGLRMLDKVVLPVLYEGTPYANRLPIGTIDVINNFKPDELRAYYKKWYRPDLQGIIVVGDIDVDKIEEKIKAVFSDIPLPENAAPRPVFEIPSNTDPIIAIASDPEQNCEMISVYHKMGKVTSGMRSSMDFYKISLIDKLASMMLNNRYAEIYRKKNSPFDYCAGYAANFFITPQQQAFELYGIPRNSDVNNALKGMLAELYRIQQYGFTDSELKRVKKTMLKGAKMDLNSNSIVETWMLAKQYIKLFINGEPNPDPEWEYEYIKNTLPEISIKDVNSRAKQYIGEDNMSIVVMAQEKNTPTKEELLQILKETQKNIGDTYVDHVVDKKLMKRKPKPGKIIKTEDAAFGYIQWTLSNGAKIWVKQTDSKEGNIILNGYSLGGQSVLSDEELPSSIFSPRKNGLGDFSESDLGRMLPGKNAYVSTSIGKYSESVGADCSIEDFETMLQMLYIKITNPRKDQEIFESDTSKRIRYIRDRLADPDEVLMDTIMGMKSSYSIRSNIGNNLQMVKKADVDRMMKIYRERFNNAGDFTFFLTGNINIDSIKPLIERYIGGLPNLRGAEKVIDHGDYPLKGKIKNHFTHKMVAPKAAVNIYYNVINPYTLETKILDSYLSKILRTVYTESIREKEGGTYSVFTGGGWPCMIGGDASAKSYNFKIAFDTDPDKYEKLLGIVYEEVQKMMDQGPSEEQVDKVKKYLLKAHKKEIKENENAYWSSVAMTLFVFGIDERSHYEEFIASVTPKMVQDYAKKIFSTEDMMEIVMCAE